MTSIASGRSSRRWRSLPPLDCEGRGPAKPVDAPLRRARAPPPRKCREEQLPPTRSPARAHGSPPPAAAAPRSGPSLTVSRSTSRASRARRDGSSTRLSCAAPSVFGPVGGQREGVEAELGIERRGLVGEQALEMLRLAAGDRGRDATPRRRCRRPDSRSATAAARRDAAARSCRPARGSAARAPGPRLRDGSPAPPAAAARAAAGRPARRSAARACGRAPGRAHRRHSSRPRNRRASASRGTSEQARRWSSGRAARASAPCPASSRSAATGSGAACQQARSRRGVARLQCATWPQPRWRDDRERAEVRQRPGRGRGRRDRDARGEPSRRSAARYRATSPRSPPNRCATPLTSSRSAIVAIDLDQRRPAPGPARQPLQQRRIAGRIGGHRDQRRVERPRIGQPRAGPRAALGRGLGDGMDDRARACPRRSGRPARQARKSLDFAQRSIARRGNQMEAIRFMRDAPAARRQPARAEQLGVPRRRARRARVERLAQRRRARDPPAHPRAAQIGGAAEPHQPARRAAALRRDRQPPRRGEVERPAGRPRFRRSRPTAPRILPPPPSPTARRAHRAPRRG